MAELEPLGVTAPDDWPICPNCHFKYDPEFSCCFDPTICRDCGHRKDDDGHCHWCQLTKEMEIEEEW